MDGNRLLRVLLCTAACVLCIGTQARGRIGAGYQLGRTTRTDALGKQSYITQGPVVHLRWSLDLSYYLDLDFGAEWRYQFLKFPSGGLHPVSGLPAGEIFNEHYLTVPLNLNFIISTEDLGALRFLDYVGAYAGPRLDWCFYSYDGSDRTFSYTKQEYGYKPLNVLAGAGVYVIKGKWSFALTAEHGFLDRCSQDGVKITNDFLVSFRIGIEFAK